VALSIVRKPDRGRGPRPTATNSWWRTRLWNPLLVVLPMAALAVMGYRRRWICDDALIFTRGVRQIVAGTGPVFSVGERAESSTSTLWQWLLAAVTWLTGWSPDRLAVGFGLVLGVAGWGLALSATCRLHKVRSNRLLLPVGILVPLALPPAWNYLTSGLETGLITAWLAVCWWWLVRLRISDTRTRAWQLAGLGLILGLGPLVRPDMAIVSVGFVAAAWLLVRPGWRPTAVLLASGVALPAGYELFRAGYYGVLMPLPGIAKEAGAADWSRGARYLKDFVQPYWLVYPLLGVCIVLFMQFLRAEHRKDRVLLLMPPIVALGLVFYVVRVGGDFMHARMLLPALSMLLLPVLVVPAGRVAVAGSIVIGTWVVLAVTLRTPFDGGGHFTANVRANDISYVHMNNPTSGTQWETAEPDERKALAEALASRRSLLVFYNVDQRLVSMPLRVGAPTPTVFVGRYLGTTGAMAPLGVGVADQWSLAYPLAAHFQRLRTLWPGHEKPVPNVWSLADYADPAAPLPKGSGVSLEALAAARHALSCGPIRELQDSVRQPLTLRRVLRNLTGAYGRTNLRIPPDPLAAERWACAAPGNRSKGKALTLRVIYARASQLAWTRRRQEEETGATGA